MPPFQNVKKNLVDQICILVSNAGRVQLMPFMKEDTVLKIIEKIG